MTGELFVYVLNSCSLVKKKCCQISRTQEQMKPVKGNLSRKTCSSYRRVSELVKILVTETCSSVRGFKVANFTGLLQICQQVATNF